MRRKRTPRDRIKGRMIALESRMAEENWWRLSPARRIAILIEEGCLRRPTRLSAAPLLTRGGAGSQEAAPVGPLDVRSVPTDEPEPHPLSESPRV